MTSGKKDPGEFMKPSPSFEEERSRKRASDGSCLSGGIYKIDNVQGKVPGQKGS